MTPRRILLLAMLAWSSMAGIARAQDATPSDPNPAPHPSAEEEAPGTDVDGTAELSHKYQVGLRVGAGMPFIFAVKYGDGPVCSTNPGETFCRGFGTPLMDVELSFGITDGAEVSFLTRFGLTEDDVTSSHPVLLGLGIRGYNSPFDAFSVFFGARVILDLTSSNIAGWTNVDFGLRGEFGLQYDFLRYIGIYTQLGVSLAFLRAFAVTIDLTGGFQVRFP